MIRKTKKRSRAKKFFKGIGKKILGVGKELVTELADTGIEIGVGWIRD